MYALPAYLLAVLAASAVIVVEFVGLDVIAGNSVLLKRPWDAALLPGLMLTTLLVFVFALVISVVPFAFFQNAYRQLSGTAARYAAILFGVAVAFFGLELMDQLVPSFHKRDYFASALLSIAPGLVSGWVFHRSRKLSRDELTSTVDG
jgi:uncharacterized membrane protein